MGIKGREKKKRKKERKEKKRNPSHTSSKRYNPNKFWNEKKEKTSKPPKYRETHRGQLPKRITFEPTKKHSDLGPDLAT